VQTADHLRHIRSISWMKTLFVIEIVEYCFLTLDIGAVSVNFLDTQPLNCGLGWVETKMGVCSLLCMCSSRLAI
jgi:hypothetical protein